MPTADALLGLGMASQQAELIGGNPSSRGAGVGTAQVGAKTILSKNNEVTPTAGQTAYILPNSHVFQDYHIYNSAATAVAALVFPPVGHTMNGTLNGSVNGGTGIPQNKSAIIWQYKPTFWASVLTA